MNKFGLKKVETLCTSSYSNNSGESQWLLDYIKSYFNLDFDLKFFENLHLESNQKICKKQLQNCSGIYIWFNKINSKFYIGRALNLAQRPFGGSKLKNFVF